MIAGFVIMDVMKWSFFSSAWKFNSSSAKLIMSNDAISQWLDISEIISQFNHESKTAISEIINGLWGITFSTLKSSNSGISGLFTIVNAEGGEITEEEQLGLLLYKEGTVCDDSFNYRAADAICKKMGFAYAKSWISGDESFSIQSIYDIHLDDVVCLNLEWDSCSYSESNNCDHSEDVFLSCSAGRGKLFWPKKTTTKNIQGVP